MALEVEIVKIVATAMLAAGGTFAVGHLTDRRPKTVHLAIQVATTLERFALDCADAAGEIQNYLDSGGHAGSLQPLPASPAYPANTAWSFLDKKLAERSLTLPNRQHASSLFISDVFYFEDVENDAGPVATANECGRLGHAAWTLAADIRRQYQLPQVAKDTLGFDEKRRLGATRMLPQQMMQFGIPIGNRGGRT